VILKGQTMPIISRRRFKALTGRPSHAAAQRRDALNRAPSLCRDIAAPPYHSDPMDPTLRAELDAMHLAAQLKRLG
jgi:hypothetical protein